MAGEGVGQRHLSLLIRPSPRARFVPEILIRPCLCPIRHFMGSGHCAEGVVCLTTTVFRVLGSSFGLSAMTASIPRDHLLPRLVIAVAIAGLPFAGFGTNRTHAAVIVFDTLSVPAQAFFDFSEYWTYGQSFNSGSGSQLTSVTLLLSSENLVSTGSAQIALWSSTAQGELGSVLASQAFGDSTVTSTSANLYTFNATNWTGSVALSQNTEYWITLASLQQSPLSALVWAGNYSSSGIGVTATTKYLYGVDGNPSSALVYEDSAGVSAPGTQNMQVEVAPVPEPSTCASLLAGLACGGYSLFRRRRAR